MENVNYLITQKRQKLYIKIYAILCLILAIGLSFYFYKKWQQYSGFREIVDANKTYITELRNVVSDEKAIYEANKSSFNALGEEIEEKLDSIFPVGQSYTDLTRQMDEYEQNLATKNNPFEVSSIDYQTPINSELYEILPMRMSIRSSADNFRKFLHLVENSGALSDQVRLMDISSIRLNFQNSDASAENEIINFTVQINAYFQ